MVPTDGLTIYHFYPIWSQITSFGSYLSIWDGLKPNDWFFYHHSGILALVIRAAVSDYNCGWSLNPFKLSCKTNRAWCDFGCQRDETNTIFTNSQNFNCWRNIRSCARLTRSRDVVSPITECHYNIQKNNNDHISETIVNLSRSNLSHWAHTAKYL